MLIVICGATASGKSRLALELAQRLNTIIISADSRQVYQKFNIGTAKPSVTEQKLVPHYLIDICEPTENFTLAEYQIKAQNLISDAANDPPLLVGGTGLYIKSITKGLKIPRVSPQPELRSQLITLGQTQLYAWLTQVDAIAAQKIHPNDQVRTLRALEVFYVTGKPISQQQGENPPDYPILQIGLDGEVEELNRRIAIRTHQMIELGLVKEVAYLIQKYGQDLPLLNTLGYAEIKQYLAGDISLAEAIDLTILHTRQFAKRQRTWFRAYPEIEWFDVNNRNLLELVWQKIQEFSQSIVKIT
ncbi:tRNA dimethylallyltransferase [Stanieria cyanosphaera PCC 7437]|uniref:tRNA dimethylallyltransferase n=1 Tax=Stanieria cyanosphaera (strain ATCC 29371 / PCC 7437) TaxID=111780 RepID=K9XUB7_STAC7|nr:tRNA (adenosine(37)-N6)-dimethylallyltransferase MiaA [Stanieria cyanosphaera]AFZ35671.1 tRNA dimethylallyltransferase [Stanieria cyanosphaera PCC 7437]